MVLRDNSLYTANDEEREALASIDGLSLAKLAGYWLMVCPNEAELDDDEVVLSLCDGKVCTGNVAGFLSVGGTNVTIRSRFAQSDEDYFLHYMLYKQFGACNALSLHSTSRDPVMDFLMYMFPRALCDALAQGLYKEYRRREYNDANLRGTVQVARHIRQNMPFRGNVAYCTREYAYDNRVTQLVRHTAECIMATANGRMLLSDATTRGYIDQIRMATPTYCQRARPQVIAQNTRVAVHPYFTQYAPLQRLCMRILRHEELKYGNRGERINGLLMDVAWLWEEYLGTLLRQLHFTHPQNKLGEGRVYLAEGASLPRYPDFYNTHMGVVVDAKYKRSVGERDDIHQVITYMHCLPCGMGVLAHPADDDAGIKEYALRGQGGRLVEYALPIPQGCASFADFAQKIAPAEQKFVDYIQAAQA